MNKQKRFVLLLVLGALAVGCMPDRMPPAPIEHNRPKFRGFAVEDSGAYAVPLRKPFRMHFSEPMMLSTFPENFVLQSPAGVVNGTFTQQDSTVVFTPSEDMAPANFYTATLRGGVKDRNGNTLTLDPQWQVSAWFFTAGQYSENGFPLVFVADRSFDKLYRIGNFEEFLDENANILRPKGMAFTPDGAHLLVVSKQLNGVVYVIDPASFTVVQEVPVGVGPEGIAVGTDKIFVVNVSGRTISVLSFPDYSQLATISFNDGFRPRDIAYDSRRHRLYISSNLISQPGTVKVLDTDTYQEVATLGGVITGRRTEKMQLSADGEWLLLLQERSDFIRFLKTADNSIADSIRIPVPQNKDMDIYQNWLFVASSGGYVFKYDVNSRALVDSVSLPASCDGVSVSPGGEILYVTTPSDTTVHVLDVQTLHVLRSTKVVSTIDKLVVSPRNY